MNDLRGKIFAFGPFRLDAGQRMLWRNGGHLTLTPKEFETLLMLVESGGRAVGKEEIIGRVWPDTFVGDSSLTRNVSVLRKALGEDVIQTLPKFGYRLTLPVTELPAQSVGAGLALAAQPVGAGLALPAQPVGAGLAPPTQGHGKPYPSAPAWAALALVAAVGAYAGYRAVHHWRNPPPKPGLVRVAVLPFVNLTGDDKQEYLCDGLTEAMISELSRVNPERLRVVARTSAMHYKHTSEAIPQIAQELHVNYLLESSVRGSGDRLRVTAQLVRGANAMHVWSGEYERNFHDILAVEQSLAIAIGEEVGLSLAPAAKARLRQAHVPDAEAYRDYLLGRFYWNKRNRQGLFQSVDYFEHAIERDPQYARAYAGLADAYLVLGGGYLPDREAYDKGRAAAAKAIELDGTLAEAYSSLAYEKVVNEWDWPGADENYQRALALDPNYAVAHQGYAFFLAAMRRPDEAVREINRALELDPLSLAVNYNAGWVYLVAGRDEEALEQLKRALDIDPRNAVVHGNLGLAYERIGRYDLAIGEFRRAQQLSDGYSPYAVCVACAYARAGRKDAARQALRGLLAGPGWAKVAPFNFAETYAALGDKDQAFRWLERSVDDRSCTVAEINTDPVLDPLRSDARFVALRRRFKLPDR
ncbi:MAG TPA: tetratricopeptide repeat protein [Terriglobia bacterium]|nr:tetratricopeptide repeat protein [Terriglobia bacterium]